MARKIIAQLTVGGSVVYIDGSEFFRLFDLRETFLTASGIDSGNDLVVQDRKSGEVIFQTANYNPADPNESFADESGTVYASRDAARAAVINFINARGEQEGSSVGTTDAAGALITASKMTTGQYTRYDLDGTNFFDKKVIGTGAVTYSRPDGHDQLTAPATSDAAVLQTRQAHPYFAGAAMETVITFSRFELQAGYIKKAGYFSSDYGTPYTANADGIFFEYDGENGVYN